VVPWDYRVVLHGIGGAYVKSIRFGETDALNSLRTEASNGERRLEVVLGLDTGGLDGRVSDANRQNIEGARVVLVPAMRHRRDLYVAVSTTAGGRFQMQSLAPGRYKLFAWAGVADGAWLDPDFLLTHEDRGVPVDVVSGTFEFLDVPLTAGDGLAAIATDAAGASSSPAGQRLR
jgi:hypothetical protein